MSKPTVTVRGTVFVNGVPHTVETEVDPKFTEGVLRGLSIETPPQEVPLTGWTCPRRAEEGWAGNSPFSYDGPGRDEWREDGTCSYDGSMHPDEFMQIVRDYKQQIGTTDKGYKFYVSGSGVGKFYTHHLSPDQGWEFDDLWKEGRIWFDYKPPRLYIPGPSTECCRNPVLDTGHHGENLCASCGEPYRKDWRREMSDG